MELAWSLDKVCEVVRTVCRHLQKHASVVDRPCIVMDIDETALLSNKHRVLRNEPLYFIYRWARQRGIKVFFVTARRQSFASHLWTMQQLALLGYDHYDGLWLMPRVFVKERTAARYKGLVRAQLQRQGHTLLLNVGDQWSDLMVLRVPGSSPTECPDPQRHYGIVSPTHPETLLVKLPNHRYVVP
jgi:hypothetical protein